MEGDVKIYFYIYWTFIALLFSLLGLFLRDVFACKKNISKANSAYKKSLLLLASDPKSLSKRERALELGYVYVDYARSINKDVFFDEVVLIKEVNSACGVNNYNDDVEKGKNASKAYR
jgi:hypothetical protein